MLLDRDETRDTRHETRDTRHETRDTRHETRDTRHDRLTVLLSYCFTVSLLPCLLSRILFADPAHLCYNRCMADKIINTFQQRRQLEQAFADLAQTQNDAELAQAARAIVHTFPQESVLTLLQKHLDTPNGQIRGGLGHLAALLPAEQTLAMLRAVAANRRLPPQTRLTAASIAQRYLGVELPAALLSDLTDTTEIAFQSLREALDEAQRNRHVLLEYVTQMQEHGEEIARMVMGLVERVDPAEQVDLLRLIAQDQRPRVAQAAMQQLERLEGTAGEAPALRALYTLQAVIAEPLKTQAERALRKARFGGKAYTPAPLDHWRALLSPADANGSQSVWLLYTPPQHQDKHILLGYAWNDLLGLTHFFGTETLDRTLLPAPHPLGELVTVTMDNGRTTTMLEAPFDYGRWLLARALLHTHPPKAQSTEIDEYKLYNDWIWQFAPPVIDPWLQQLWATEDAAETSGAPKVESKAIDPHALTIHTETLFQHPAMAGWQLRNWALLPVAYQKQLPTQEVVSALLTQMAKSADSQQLITALTAGLRAQAAWFYVAQETELAKSAAWLAQQLPNLPIADNPVLAHLFLSALNQARRS